MRVLVTGGRDFADCELLNRTLRDLHPTVVAQGGARGADSLAAAHCAREGVKCLTYPADWHAHGRAAGPIRNVHMLRDFKPDLVVAFPGGQGTAHMVSIAQQAGVRVIEVSP